MKLVSMFSKEIALPLTHIINSIFETYSYPELWKTEVITPIQKCYPASTMKELRPISQILVFPKIFDRILAEYLSEDLEENSDPKQYGNQRGLSINHYLINMLNKILTGLDRNSASEKNAAILMMIDYAQAYEMQSHTLGVRSFISNGVRNSLVPVLVNFFSDRKIIVKWNGEHSFPRSVAAGSLQGINAGGILEFLSHTAHNLSFLDNDSAWKFIDDESYVEIVNLFQSGLASFNCKKQVPSDMSVNDMFLSSDNFHSQSYLDRINNWAVSNLKKLNSAKTRYMIVNFCQANQFQTRLTINDSLISQVKEARLLGCIIRDDLRWISNTNVLVNGANARSTILQKNFHFGGSRSDLVTISTLFIGS